MRFRTSDWGSVYEGYSVYATTAVFPEHLKPADPRSPGVAALVRELEREAAAQQRHVSGCKRWANGQGATVPKPKQENGQSSPATAKSAEKLSDGRITETVQSANRTLA